MRMWFVIIFMSSILMGCASLSELFRRHDDVVPPVAQEEKADPTQHRATRRSLEEESMLYEQSGSLWVSRGQSSFLFANNNQRLLGDLLEVKIEGYPKEQVTMKVNTIAKLLAEILNEQKQDIKLKQDEIKKQMTPEYQQEQEEVRAESRGLASIIGLDGDIPPETGPTPEQQLKDQEKALKRLDDEEQDIKGLSKNKEFPIRTVSTRVMEIQKDGNYRVRGEQPFMIGKREYKLLVAGTVRAEEYNEKGMSAEALIDPVFDIISDRKGEGL